MPLLLSAENFDNQTHIGHHMLNILEEQIVAPRSTCTKDEAVARLLGWMKGPAYPKNIPFGPFGVPTDQYVNLQFLEGNIQNQLSIYRETARQEWLAANATGVDDSGESVRVLLDCYDLAAKAEKYLIEISDEIAKGDASVLRIDRDATSGAQDVHYTLKSVEEWATKALGLSVIQANIFTVLHEVEIPEVDDVPILGTNQVMRHKGTKVDDEVEEDETQETGKGLGEIKANNLYIAFALLVEAYAKDVSGYATNGGRDIEDAIAKHLAALGKTANKGYPMPGLRHGAIAKNISEGMKRKARKLNQG